MTGIVIEFPQLFQTAPLPKSCENCLFFSSGYMGDYCRAYNEDIMNVHTAESCELYEEP